MGIDLHLDLYANYDYKNRTMPFLIIKSCADRLKNSKIWGKKS